MALMVLKYQTDTDVQMMALCKDTIKIYTVYRLRSYMMHSTEKVYILINTHKYTTLGVPSSQVWNSKTSTDHCPSQQEKQN